MHSILDRAGVLVASKGWLSQSLPPSSPSFLSISCEIMKVVGSSGQGRVGKA